ncbi:MAG TPA: hypothetical protein PKH07_06015, partial [bacterium]|nr:hypothetical protein [bacterium]
MLLDKRKHWITLALALAVIGIWTILLRDVRDLFLEKETSEEAQRDGSLSPENWPMFRGTPSLQGYVDAELPRKLFLEWVFKTKGAIRSSAAVVNN